MRERERESERKKGREKGRRASEQLSERERLTVKVNPQNEAYIYIYISQCMTHM